MKTLNKLCTLPLLLGCLVLLGLFGCSDSKKENGKEANIENFTKALQVAIDKHRDSTDICIRPPTQQFPGEIDPSDSHPGTQASLRIYDTLVSAGLLTRSDAQVKAYYGGPIKGPVNGFRYDLTEEGKKYHRTIVSSSYFCFGHRKVKAIESITPSGDTVYRINYTYTVEDVPDWANMPAIRKEFRGLTEEIDRPPQSEARALLRKGEWNEGHWRIKVDCFGNTNVCSYEN